VVTGKRNVNNPSWHTGFKTFWTSYSLDLNQIRFRYPRATDIFHATPFQFIEIKPDFSYLCNTDSFFARADSGLFFDRSRIYTKYGLQNYLAYFHLVCTSVAQNATTSSSCRSISNFIISSLTIGLTTKTSFKPASSYTAVARLRASADRIWNSYWRHVMSIYLSRPPALSVTFRFQDSLQTYDDRKDVLLLQNLLY